MILSAIPLGLAVAILGLAKAASWRPYSGTHRRTWWHR